MKILKYGLIWINFCPLGECSYYMFGRHKSRRFISAPCMYVLAESMFVSCHLAGHVICDAYGCYNVIT